MGKISSELERVWFKYRALNLKDPKSFVMNKTTYIAIVNEFLGCIIADYVKKERTAYDIFPGIKTIIDNDLKDNEIKAK